WIHGFVIDKNRRSKFYSQRVAHHTIRFNSFLNFFPVHVLLKLIDIESNRSCVGLKQFARIWSFAPGSLFSIQCVVHLPEMALQRGGFGRQGSLASVLV